MPAIIDLLEGAEQPVAEIPTLIHQVETYLKAAWDTGIQAAVDAGSIPESIVAPTLETEGAAADIFATAAEGATLVVSLVSLVGILVLLVLILVAVAIVALHRQIHHVAVSIPLVGGVLSGWEDDAYNVIRPILHGIEQQLIQQLTNFFIDLRKLIQWLYGIDPYRLTRFIERYITTHIHDVSTSVATVTNTVNTLVSNLTGTVQHLWTNVHSLWSRITYVENELTNVQRDITYLNAGMTLAFTGISDLWDFADMVVSKLALVQAEVGVLSGELVAQAHRLGEAETEIGHMLDHIAYLESVVVPSAGVASFVAPLMPLADAGMEGIDNLVKTANGECICEEPPGNLEASQCGWLNKILHAAGGVPHAQL